MNILKFIFFSWIIFHIPIKANLFTSIRDYFCKKNKAPILINDKNSYPQFKIALCTTATGKYIEFVEPFLKSARQYFLTNYQVKYIIFTDSKLDSVGDDTILIQHKKLGWPFDTCCRSKAYIDASDLISTFDYAFACDIDMEFVNECGEEILSDRVAVLHAGFLTKRGSYDENRQSVANVWPDEGQHYFAGGMYGGNAREFIKINKFLSSSLDLDLQHNVIAVWHDESYLNRYFIDNPPTLILSSSYCYPDPKLGIDLPVKPILIALLKDHKFLRE